MPPGRRSANPFAPLQKHRNFRLFWTGQTVSLVGSWMQQVATGWMALELSNSAFVVGLVSAAGTFPVLLLSLYGGVVADRYSKLRLVTIAQACLLVEATLLWWFVWSGEITIGWLVALVSLGGVIAAFEIPARQSFIVELVGREDLIESIALNSGGFNLARIIGPAIGALIIAQWGIAWCFGVNALSYFAVLASLALIRLPAWQRSEITVSPFDSIREGLRYIRATPAVDAMIRIIAIYSIFGLSYLSMLPVFARDVLHSDAAGYGALLTSVGVGALTGALSIAALGRRIRRGRLFALSSYGFAVSVLIIAVMRWLHPAQVVLFVAGLTMFINGALANGILQSIVPDELRGRVMSVYVFVYVGFAPIGSLIAGAMARAIGVDWAIGISAAIMLAYTIWALWKYPILRDV